MTKFFNVTLKRETIAQAYEENESYNSMCFLIGPEHSSSLPIGFKIIDVELTEEGELLVNYDNKTPYDVHFYIDNGELFVRFTEGDDVMALVDLGNVIGPQGPQGIQGETGPQGPQGVQGDPGISPSFVIGDGTGGTTAGHLYADYDNPYVPN